MRQCRSLTVAAQKLCRAATVRERLGTEPRPLGSGLARQAHALGVVFPTVFLGELVGRQHFLAGIGLDDVNDFLLDARRAAVVAVGPKGQPLPGTQRQQRQREGAVGEIADVEGTAPGKRCEC
jgi:hypothetical protein